MYVLSLLSLRFYLCEADIALSVQQGLSQNVQQNSWLHQQLASQLPSARWVMPQAFVFVSLLYILQQADSKESIQPQATDHISQQGRTTSLVRYREIPLERDRRIRRRAPSMVDSISQSSHSRRTGSTDPLAKEANKRGVASSRYERRKGMGNETDHHRRILARWCHVALGWTHK